MASDEYLRKAVKKITDKISDDSQRKMRELEEVMKTTLLTHTKIKEPITKGKLKWHGVRMVSQPCNNLWWLEQRGKIIGEKHIFSC